MTTKTALLALLAMWGVGTTGALPAYAEDAAPAEESADDGDFTDRIWTKADSPDLPGVMRIFLSDGTLVSDSCWETHRLSQWKRVSATQLVWDEDGMEIKAEIVSHTGKELVLMLDLPGGGQEERYVPADVPFVCPDMPA